MLLRKIIIFMLIPLFVMSNICLAEVISVKHDTLATPLVSELLNDKTLMEELKKIQPAEGRTVSDRVQELQDEWTKKVAKLLVDKYIKKTEVATEKISKYDLINEIAGQINALIAIEKIPSDTRGSLISAMLREIEPGYLAGFTGKDLPREVEGISVRNLFDQVIAKLAPETKPRLVRDLISEEQHSRLSAEELDIKIFPISDLINEFKEAFRKELKEKGYDEPKREEIVNKYALEVISHPGITRRSIYIEASYYDILTKSEYNENWEDLIIQWVKHEGLHISDRTLPEKEVYKLAPIDDVVAALKKRTVLIAQSGGDCAGLNAVVATATQELTKKGFIPMGVREGFSGLTSDDFDQEYRIHLDTVQAERIRKRPSTELFSSREAPFKVIDWYANIIRKQENPAISKTYLDKIKNIKNWNDLDKDEESALEGMYDILMDKYEEIDDEKLKKEKDPKDAIEKAFRKFILFMEHIEEYGGLIVTGGDDHCKIAMKVNDFNRMAVAIPKSIDNDAMTQMLGFYKSAKHFLARFLIGAVTGKGKAKVFIAEIMGRSAGWLALASGDRAGRVPQKALETLGEGDVEAGKKKAEFIKSTTIIIVPEKNVSIRGILQRSQEIYEKYGVINLSVSEGYKVDPKDPLLDELRRKNPLIEDVWQKVEQGKIESDMHGHPKLEGATDFIFAILTTRWEDGEAKKYDIGLKPDEIKHAIFGYTGRGLRPGKYDLIMAKKLTKKAVELIEKGQSGWMATYPDKGLHPYDSDPLVRSVEAVLNDREGFKYPKDLTTLGEEGVDAYIDNELAVRGFRILTDAELIGRGVLIEKDGKVKGHRLKSFEKTPSETVLDFEIAVKLLREDMISSSISANTNRRGSIFEVPDDRGLLTLALSDKYPDDYKDWDNVDKASWEKISPKILALVPGREQKISDIVEEASQIKKQHGVVFIVVGSGYGFSEKDKDFRKLVSEDPYLKAKYDMLKQVVEDETDLVKVKYISHFIRAALMKYAKEDFPSKSSANCNPLGQMYEVAEPDGETAASIINKANAVEVDKVSKEMDIHSALPMQNSIDTGKMVVIIDKNLTAPHTVSEESISINVLEQQYKVMKQKLAKMFSKEAGIIEAETAQEIREKANYYIGLGYKVIILNNSKTAREPSDIRLAGRIGKDYCLIHVGDTADIRPDTAPFINLNAMAMMGVGVLGDDYRLFSLAFKAFTGQEPNKEIEKRFKDGISWAITVLPRIIELTGTMVDLENIRKIFAAAA
ncbi:MAG: 6-phosphofructokinase [Candidatus Aadella gelida]|nr:6-phosphofructokinase [Candidatus Aadella gelida]